MRLPNIILVLVIASVCRAHAQSDNLAGAKAAVQACVVDVRNQAKRPENFQFGGPPMWKDFDAYTAPDGRVFNNARLVGEMDGVYRFNKCLAAHGFSIGGAPAAASPTAANPTATCADEELVQRPGDCWVKLSAWEKHLYVRAFEEGVAFEHQFSENQQYNWIGKTKSKFPHLDNEGDTVSFIDDLYAHIANRTISVMDAFDLSVRKLSDPSTKDLPYLIAMYQNRHKPIRSGYLRGFSPPNKVLISEHDDAMPKSFVERFGNKINTVTLLGISSTTNTPAEQFMRALLNIKNCNTLIKATDVYKYLTYLKDENERENVKELEQRDFSKQLKVLLYYPFAFETRGPEEFFNAAGELSAIVLLEGSQTVCSETVEGFKEPLLRSVTLGQLLLAGAAEGNQNQKYDAPWLEDGGNAFINLNQYLTTNGLQQIDSNQNDPRPAAKYFLWVHGTPTKEGVEKVLTVGASDNH